MLKERGMRGTEFDAEFTRRDRVMSTGELRRS